MSEADTKSLTIRMREAYVRTHNILLRTKFLEGQREIDQATADFMNCASPANLAALQNVFVKNLRMINTSEFAA